METKALIVGGGIAGLTLANLLAKAGLPCILVDNGDILTDKEVKASGRTVALMNSSISVIQAANLKDDITELGTPLKQMRLKDDGNPNIDVKEVNFPANDIGLDQFGFNIPNLKLKQILQKQLKKNKKVSFLTGTKLEEYKTSEQKVYATLSDGSKITADVIIGVDGRNSKVRNTAGISVKEEEYNQSAITCIISHTKPHDNVSTEHHRPGGPFTLVPMEGNQSAIVWAEKTDETNRIMALPKNLFEKTLQENSHGIVGKITLENSPESWPLKTLIAQKFTSERVAIAAEAAHVMSPIGAQGLNLSLRDVAALAETIVDAARVGADIGSDNVLKTYDSRRKLDVLTRVAGIDRFSKIVSNNIGFLRGIRRTGLMSLEAIPPLKQFIMHQGLAPNMDEGRLVRGEAL